MCVINYKRYCANGMFILIFKCLSRCDFISTSKKDAIDGNRTREHSTAEPFNFTSSPYRLGVYSCQSSHTGGATQWQ